MLHTHTHYTIIMLLDFWLVKAPDSLLSGAVAQDLGGSKAAGTASGTLTTTPSTHLTKVVSLTFV